MGLTAHRQFGRALVAEQLYTLLVSGSAMDAEGCAIGDDARHRFSVEIADEVAPAPSQWVIRTPDVSTKQPLIIDLGSSHDHVSLAYRIRVLDKDGGILPGKIVLADAEKTWKFIPRSPWQGVEFSVMIDGSLEDLAGNRPGRLFDSTSEQTRTAWISRLYFVPRAPEKWEYDRCSNVFFRTGPMPRRPLHCS